VLKNHLEVTLNQKIHLPEAAEESLVAVEAEALKRLVPQNMLKNNLMLKPVIVIT
jgi:hypothetical protein